MGLFLLGIHGGRSTYPLPLAVAPVPSRLIKSSSRILIASISLTLRVRDLAEKHEYANQDHRSPLVFFPTFLLKQVRFNFQASSSTTHTTYGFPCWREIGQKRRIETFHPLRVTQSSPRLSMDVELVDAVQHSCQVTS